jgi:hypothetical protein
MATRLAEVVRSVRVSEPRDGVAEVCAIIQQVPGVVRSRCGLKASTVGGSAPPYRSG